LRGGISSLMNVVDVRMAGGGALRLVLRRCLPEYEHDAETARREWKVLDRFRGTGVPAPEPMWLDAEGEVSGSRPWQ
jgi:hypothetical protein